MAERTVPAADSVAVSDHLRSSEDGPADADLPPGVYRVVGAPEDAATLLRVTGADGRRVHTGEVYRLPRTDLGGFEAAENPDENRSLVASVAGQLDGLAWQFRLIGRAVRERPIPGTIALALVAVGLFGGPYLPIPDAVDALLVLTGGFALFALRKTRSQ